MKNEVLFVILSVLVSSLFAQILNFEKKTKANRTTTVCCQEPKYDTLEKVFYKQVQSDTLRIQNQLLMEQFEKLIVKLNENFQKQVDLLHTEVIDLPLETEIIWDKVKYNILKQTQMEDKLLDLTNKYWYKARSRGRKVKLLYDPNPVLIDKIFLTTNNFEAVKPFNRAAILHNKFNFKIYNRTHVPRDYVPDFAWGVVDLYYKEEGRLCLSHYPAMGYAYHHKYTWARNLKEFDLLNDFHFKSTNFTKPSYMINITVSDVNEWENELFKLYNTSTVLIEKLPKMSLGFGILMQKNVTKYIDGLKICKFELDTRPTECPYFQHFKKSWDKFDNTTLLQQYITNPLLLDGRKFDMRTFLFTFWTGKHFLYFVKSLNIRRALNKYDINSDDVKTVHATHTSAYDIYKKNNTYDKMLKYAQSHIPGFKQEFKNENPDGENTLKKMFHKNAQILVYAGLAGQRKLPMQELKKGQHHLLGCDVMFDTDYNPWLMECNRYPQTRYTTPQKEHAMPTIAKNVMDIVMHFQDNWDQMDQIAKNPEQIPVGNMTMVYNDATGFNYIDVKLEDAFQFN